MSNHLYVHTHDNEKILKKKKITFLSIFLKGFLVILTILQNSNILRSFLSLGIKPK